jgi:hypothetical protein
MKCFAGLTLLSCLFTACAAAMGLLLPTRIGPFLGFPADE